MMKLTVDLNSCTTFSKLSYQSSVPFVSCLSPNPKHTRPKEKQKAWSASDKSLLIAAIRSSVSFSDSDGSSSSERGERARETYPSVFNIAEQLLQLLIAQSYLPRPTF